MTLHAVRLQSKVHLRKAASPETPLMHYKATQQVCVSFKLSTVMLKPAPKNPRLPAPLTIESSMSMWRRGCIAPCWEDVGELCLNW